ncbi:ABC transporter substrate-binding protein [Ornithinicoccus hortensis]|uniref:Amino acid/amide ABC transporter substrate-binding protein (HAAT family) n=1 Tax=Ornithinicoccus hortensis TaxID=82346 RepID=A0A542YSN8_9MICO|nr:ABC transporter substrate-binding protein [Ornithinicoccus hortensis]TQL51088.1 amino acid/amide ABC transporter substrate-binding protein (HAAT family) [Ornithinicoccus hortensis]
MRNRKFWSLVTVAALAVGAAGCAEEDGGGGDDGGGGTAAGGGGEEESGPIKIGVVLDITGAGASLGVAERETIEMLAEQVNEDGGIDGREVEVIIEDNQSTEDGAAKATSSLLSTEEVDILIGASRTGPSLAMRPLAEDAEIPMISLAANQAIIDGSEWVFKTAQNDRVVLERMVDDMSAKGYTKVAIARDASGFGEGIPEMLAEIGEGAGIEIVAQESFAPDATDFTAQMVNLRNADADAVVIWGIPPAAALAQNAYVQLDVGAPVYQSHGIGNQVFLDEAGANADGLLAPLGRMLIADQLADDDPQKEVVQTFIADYTEKYDKAPSTFAGHAYDGFMIAVDALDEVGTDPQALRDHLENGITDWPGISGVFTMSPEDHSGLTKEALMMVEVQDGQWTLAEDQ